MFLITEKKLNDNLILIQDIRKEKPYFLGLISSFFIFENETQFLNDLSILDILKKLSKLQDNFDFHNIFYIGFIEMLLKLNAFYVYYKDYDKR